MAERGVTQLLFDVRHGDELAMRELMPLVYHQLKHLAAGYLRHERRDHTLQPTALVHEAFLRLVDQRDIEWQSRAHFMAVAATLMRRILVDYARNHRAAKRGGERQRVELEEHMMVDEDRLAEMLALDQAIERLQVLDAQQARIVELRCFGGLSVEETAEVLRVSAPTVKRDWAMAKAWLQRELSKGVPGDARTVDPG
jgi:RNA polymerase sigma factor (TIGR02999 family)